jgi:micrococcal nuclease
MHLNLLNRLAKATSSTCCFIRVLVVFGCSIPTVSVAHAQVIPDQLEFLRSAHVRVVVDGDTLILTDGSVVRLVGIMAPRLPFGREEIPQQPFAQEARDALDALVWDQKIDLYIGGTSPDRHGRILAHVFTQDGTCVQAELLDQGMARTYTFADNRAVIDLMLEHETQARAMAVGMWSHPFFQIRDAGEPGLVPVDTFELIEGRIVEVAEFDRRIYLNFGDDWRQDTTVTVSPNNRSIFADADVDFAALEGKKIRVRGWTQWYNGPVIEIDHPEQIEVLEQ